MDNAYTDVAKSESQLLVRFASGLSPLPKPVNTAPPVISGIPVVGQTLYSTSGTWTKNPTSYDYVWYWNTDPIGVGNTYTLIALDIGGMITCKVRATNAQGTSGFTASNALGPVLAGGTGLLLGEANGWATDFLYPTDAERVALKASNVVTKYAVDSFIANAGTSPKMVYDSAGVLRWSPHNRMLQSQTFDHALWSKGQGSIAANVIAAPDGLLTADKFIEDNTSNVHFVAQSNVAPNGTYSIYAKDAGRRYILLCLGSFPNSAIFDLVSGVVLPTTSLGTVTPGAVIQSLGGGWYCCSIPVASAATEEMRVHLYNGTSHGYVGDGVSGVYLGGAQLNSGIVPTAYLPTTTAARFGLAIDYDPITHALRGLLCEPAATNLLTRSNDVSGMNAEGGTGTLNNQTGPDGALTADTFTEDTASFNHGFYGAGVASTANADYTISRFFKMGTRRYCSIGWSDGTNGAYAVYDLQTGVVGSSAGIGTGIVTSARMQACPNGWYRCILTAKISATSPIYSFNAATAATITPDGYGRQVYLGTAATLFYGHGQIEAGALASSPIPTPNATVTRAGNNYSVTPASINHSATAGSWWAETYLLEGSNNRYVIAQNSGSYTPLAYNGSAPELFTPQLYVLTPTLNLLMKMMSAFQTSDRAVTGKGLAPATDTNSAVELLNPPIINIGGDPGWSNSVWGWLRRLRYLPRRPTGAEMQTQTEPDYIPISLAAPNSLAPAGKMTWNAGTGVLSLVGAAPAENCTANFGVATVGKTYRIRFNVDALAGDSFSFFCGNTMAGQISGTGAKTFTLVAAAATPLIGIIEWGGTLTDLTLSNIRVDEVVTT